MHRQTTIRNRCKLRVFDVYIYTLNTISLWKYYHHTQLPCSYRLLIYVRFGGLILPYTRKTIIRSDIRHIVCTVYVCVSSRYQTHMNVYIYMEKTWLLANDKHISTLLP